MTPENVGLALTWVFVGIGILVIALLTRKGLDLSRARRAIETEAAPPRFPPGPVGRAHLEFSEVSRFTTGGIISIVLLVLWNLIFPFWLSSAKSAPQEAVIALLWIGGNQIFIGGAIIGRTRSYFLTRTRK